MVYRDSKIHNYANSLFCWWLIGLVVWPISSDLSKFQQSFCLSFSWTDVGFCIYQLFVWSYLIFWHNSQWITIPLQSCLVIYSFWANMLHSLIVWLMVSSLLPHNLHLLFCCVKFILALIELVLIALFCAAIETDSVSLLRLVFPFLATSMFPHVCIAYWSLKTSIVLFCFPFLLLSNCSVCPRVVSIVSGGCNKSSSTLLYVVFNSLYWCFNTFFNAGRLSSFFFS